MDESKGTRNFGSPELLINEILNVDKKHPVMILVKTMQAHLDSFPFKATNLPSLFFSLFLSPFVRSLIG